MRRTMLFTHRSGVLSCRLGDGTVPNVSADLADLFTHGETGLTLSNRRRPRHFASIRSSRSRARPHAGHEVAGHRMDHCYGERTPRPLGHRRYPRRRAAQRQGWSCTGAAGCASDRTAICESSTGDAAIRGRQRLHDLNISISKDDTVSPGNDASSWRRVQLGNPFGPHEVSTPYGDRNDAGPRAASRHEPDVVAGAWPIEGSTRSIC